MPDHNLKQLVSSRAAFRGQVTTIFNDYPNFRNFTDFKINNSITKLDTLNKKLSELDELIRELKWKEYSDPAAADQANVAEILESDTYADKINECLSMLQIELGSRNTVVPTTDAFRTMLKSPVAPLPTFSGTEGENLDKFFRQFEETINRFNYTDYDKLLLLKQQVSGRALVLLNALEIDNQSYAFAKNLLIEALASPITQKFNVIKQLSQLKLSNSTDPFQYIGNLRSIDESFQYLKISIQDVIQYFCLTGMNDSFKSQLILLTGKTKPSFEDIKKYFFEANERYTSLLKSNQTSSSDISKESTVGFATKVDFKSSKGIFHVCPLCETNNEHAINKCRKYGNSIAKIERLRVIDRCTKCAGIKHTEENCKFKFSRRCSCGKYHFSFLCDAKKTEPVPSTSSSTCATSNVQIKARKIVNFEALQSRNVILPTFAAHTNNTKIRCLRDSGSQSNYILDSIARSENLKVVSEDIYITVNGFNSSKDYDTREVSVPLKINNTVTYLDAICIPNFNLNLTLPGLSGIASEFRRKNFNLSDDFLHDGGDKVGNLSLILGSSSTYCLCENMVKFGGDPNHNINPSVYSITPAGIMLQGNIKDLEYNMKYLSNRASSFVNTSSVSVDKVVVGSSDVVSQNSSIEHDIPQVSEIDLHAASDEIVISSSDIVGENTSIGHDISLNSEVDLHAASDGELDDFCCKTLSYDKPTDYENISLYDDIISNVLNSTARSNEGRLVMPVMWNSEVSHMLGNNFALSRNILRSNLKKFKNNKTDLLRIDQYFVDQENKGIIAKIPNLDKFMDNNVCSFLPHMSIFKPERETTKLRVVFMSNLCEKNNNKISHNQSMLSGPSLNHKLSTALMHLRFDSFLLCFDIVKAFLQIELPPDDQNKLSFLWFNDVANNDFSVVAYKSIRLPFGLVCSPCMLMLALYKILIIDAKSNDEEDRNMKELIWALFYMDNGALTFNESSKLFDAYHKIADIFSEYRMDLQQFTTNLTPLQSKIDINDDEKTPVESKLLGLLWNRDSDKLSTKMIEFDDSACTKQEVLRCIASHFDLFGFTLPLLNRARLFLQKLQCDSSLGWKDILSDELRREWRNICRQVNSSTRIEISRCVGRRDGNYSLLAFTDASISIYGVVIYILDNETNNLTFLIAKNRLINRQLRTKSIPSLELQAMLFGVETLIDTWKELSGSSCTRPINITNLYLFSDSMVSLCWINSHVTNLDKMNKKKVFVLNRLQKIVELCSVKSITFKFINGLRNPADHVTRPVSPKLLSRDYFCGPEDFKISALSNSESDEIEVVVPRVQGPTETVSVAQIVEHSECVSLIDTKKYSRFQRIVSVMSNVFKFITNCKLSIARKRNSPEAGNIDENCHGRAVRFLVRQEQKSHFTDIFQYFRNQNFRNKDMPDLVRKMNLFVDCDGILRVRSKFNRWKNKPVL